MTDYSGLDVCCFYTDLGREGYEPLMADMTASAHEQMPGCRTLLLSPNPTAKTAQHFDGVVPIENCDVDANKLCFNRGRAHVSWMTLTERPALLVDPDIVFRSPFPLDRECDVGLNWRGKPDQPVNSGAVFARPGCPKFWHHYGTVCVNLPKKLWHWWVDQLSFSLMTGVCHEAGEILRLDDARVALWSAEDNCGSDDIVTDKAWAIHKKGRRKGPGWEHVFVSADGPLPPGVEHCGPVAT